MSVDQFLITAFLAMILGIVLCFYATLLLVRIKEYYIKLTFKHEVLEPYIRIKKEKDEQ